MAARTTAAMIRTSRQEVRPRSPKVQNTMLDSCTSSAKYCSRVDAPENRELRATPAQTMASGVMVRSRDRAKITSDTAMLHTKAHTLMVTGDVKDMAPEALLPD